MLRDETTRILVKLGVNVSELAQKMTQTTKVIGLYSQNRASTLH